jgi:hypothetical protein
MAQLLKGATDATKKNVSEEVFDPKFDFCLDTQNLASTGFDVTSVCKIDEI